MPNNTTKIILNPNANLGRAWLAARDLRPVVDQFGGADWAGTVYPTHATELARQAGEEGYKTVVAAGGDGTVHEVINGLMQLEPEIRPCLGVIPLGSGNDFAFAAGIDTDPISAIKQIFSGQSRRVDIGQVSDEQGRLEYWDNAVGVGFDATVTIRSRRFTYLRGFLIYLLAVLQTILLNHEAPKISFKSEREAWEKELMMLVLCNGGREGGGFQIAPHAQPDDSLYHYVGIEKVSRLMMLRLLPEFINGTHLRFRQVVQGDFTEVEIQSDRPLTVHIDGEIYAGFGMNVRRLSARILPGALEVLGAPPAR